MPIALNRDIRRTLEDVVRKARIAAEDGAQTALRQFGVADAKRPSWLKEADAAQRVRLRAHARALGDPLDTGDPARMPRLIREIAYAHWHRALFAHFLLENGLLVDVDAGNAPVRPDELREIAEAEGKDIAEVAAEFAAPMLPEIFPKDDPVLALALPPETRQRLAELVDGLPAQTFKADDSLGWTYQFWQADRKKKVNESEVKIGADELPAVTQLFTEDYMVLFLLENTLGAWWAGKKLAEDPDLARDAADEDELRRKLSPDGYLWTYLRFVREGEAWRPAAGTFPEWPARAADIKMLDPCMGSGHFLVFALDILVALRKAEEELDDTAAVSAVLRDNLYGLEIDPRCTQIAAFALALASWKRLGGVQPLPEIHLACSGLAIGMGKAEFVRLAEKIAEAEGFAGGPADLLGRERNPMEETALARRRGGLERLHDLFAQAPVLGSLIDPRRALGDFGGLFEEGFDGLAALIGKALARASYDAELREVAVTAQGLSKAAELLAGQFTLVVTNVPYLTYKRASIGIKSHTEQFFPLSKMDLATVMIDRFRVTSSSASTIASVSPQNWLFLGSYQKFRTKILKNENVQLVAFLGSGAFETISGEVVNVALTVIGGASVPKNAYSGIDVSSQREAEGKARSLSADLITIVPQHLTLSSADSRITLSPSGARALLQNYAISMRGIVNGDGSYWTRLFWEVKEFQEHWRALQSTVADTVFFGGREHIINWSTSGEGMLRPGTQNEAYGCRGVTVSQIGSLPCTFYSGDLYDNNVSPLIPKRETDLPALFAFTESPEFASEVRKIDKKMNVTNATFLKIPFDLTLWQRIALEKYPNGLPKPYSNDPTQWLFDGHPRGSANPNALEAQACPTRPGMSEHPLQVAVARLLGYRWPRQTGSSFMDCPAVTESDEIERAGVVDKDGIVPLPSLQGEAPAHERLRAVLQAAWGADWADGVERACLVAEDWDGNLESWLADGFFEGHCKLFHQTPFIWHIWDGARGGFSALVNYHRLCAPGGEGRRLLEKLRDTYLGEWIGLQRRLLSGGDATAEDRLAAAEHLRDELTRIIEGEPPYDIFVRWKPLHEQPIGWEPDINDGVRLNIRPFLTARPRGKTATKACILRVTPSVKKHEGADRGGEPIREKEDCPWFWAEDHDVTTVDFAGGAKFLGRRYNNFHYTRAFKEAARARRAKGKARDADAAE